MQINASIVITGWLNQTFLSDYINVTITPTTETEEQTFYTELHCNNLNGQQELINACDPAARTFEHLLQGYEKIGANLFFFPESLKIYGMDSIRYKQLIKKLYEQTNKWLELNSRLVKIGISLYLPKILFACQRYRLQHDGSNYQKNFIWSMISTLHDSEDSFTFGILFPKGVFLL